MYPQSPTKFVTESPLIIVGMPRCGSTILTRLLNESPDLLIINDFYYLQYVDAINGFNKNDALTRDKLVKYITKWLIKRITRSDATGIGCGLAISPQQEAKIKDFIQKFNPDSHQDWALILQEIMNFSTNTAGKKVWGYNTPQDYLNLDVLASKFPESKFVFMIRNPQSMLSSYKFMIKEEADNNDSIRYHPILQTLAWRTAVRTFLKAKKNNPEQFLLVRYENLVTQTNQTLSLIEKLTTATFPDLDVCDFGNNSSFRDKKRKMLDDTEIWLCEKIAKKEIEILGYSISDKKPRLQDLGNLVFVSLRVFWYYSIGIFTSANIRKRVIKLAKKIMSDKNYENY